MRPLVTDETALEFSTCWQHWGVLVEGPGPSVGAATATAARTRRGAKDFIVNL
jgi:hypothetical protein